MSPKLAVTSLMYVPRLAVVHALPSEDFECFNIYQEWTPYPFGQELERMTGPVTYMKELL